MIILPNTPAHPGGQSTGRVLRLRPANDPPDRLLDHLQGLDVLERTPDGEAAGETWCDEVAAAVAERLGDGPVHVIACGAAVPTALGLAAHRQDLVASVIAGDPEVDQSDAGYWELLRQVRAPTLVLVAAPEPDTDTSQAQSVAGGVENGVMVVVDGAVAPTQRSRPESFTEWATAFMVIAEGLPNPSEEQAHA